MLTSANIDYTESIVDDIESPTNTDYESIVNAYFVESSTNNELSGNID